MKIAYISLLSLAIIGQGAYFYYDFTSKNEQTVRTSTAIGQLSSRVDEAEHSVTDLHGLYQTAVSHAAEESATSLRKVLDDRLAELQKRDATQQAELQKHDAKQQEALDARIADLKKDQEVQQAFFESRDQHLRDMFSQTLVDNEKTRKEVAQDNEHVRKAIAQDNEATRQATEDQTNHVLADLRDLRVNTLARLSENEFALKEVKLFVGQKADGALKKKIQVQSAKLFDPDAH
jgi:hypothetical protein